MKRVWKFALVAAATTGLVTAFQNCTKAGFGQNDATLESLQTAYGGPVICNPLNDAGATSSANTTAKNGLAGQLIYETAANQQALGTATNFADLVAKGTVAPATLIMSNIDVPTRSFTAGFSAAGQAPLTDSSTGQTLVEWFGIDMKSTVKLAAGDQAGFYQFATITDDGSNLLANGSVLVNNDGIHSTLAKCSATAVYFDGTTALPIEFQYLQGPRDQIAARIAWRKVSSANPDQANCGIAAAGWQIIPPQNFFLPPDAPLNTCN